MDEPNVLKQWQMEETKNALAEADRGILPLKNKCGWPSSHGRTARVTPLAVRQVQVTHNFDFMAMIDLTTAVEVEANSLFAPRTISSVTFCPASAFLTTSPAAL